MFSKSEERNIFESVVFPIVRNATEGAILTDDEILKICSIHKINFDKFHYYMRMSKNQFITLKKSVRRVRKVGYEILANDKILEYIQEATSLKVNRTLSKGRRELDCIDLTKLDISKKEKVLRSKSSFDAFSSLIENGLCGRAIEKKEVSELINSTTRELEILNSLFIKK